MTKGDLLKLLEPYADNEEIVFVTFDETETSTYHRASVAMDHCTTRRESDGSMTMPVAIYLIDDGAPGEVSIMG